MNIQKCMLPHKLKQTLHCLSKAKCSVFYYSLFVHIMYMTGNKATFIVIEIINPIIRNSKNSTINTTSLSHSKRLCSKVATHICFFVHFLCSILYSILKLISIKNAKFVKNSAKYVTIHSL